MSQPRSDWLFLILRGLVLLVLGWAFGALYGLTSLGFLAIFLPISGALLGFSPERATSAGWMVTLCACLGALATFAQELSFQSLVLVLWGAYIFGGLVGNAVFPRRWRITLQTYLLLLLMAIGAGIAWQAYPTLSGGGVSGGGGAYYPSPAKRVALCGAERRTGRFIGGDVRAWRRIRAGARAGICGYGATWRSLAVAVADATSCADQRDCQYPAQHVFVVTGRMAGFRFFPRRCGRRNLGIEFQRGNAGSVLWRGNGRTRFDYVESCFPIGESIFARGRLSAWSRAFTAVRYRFSRTGANPESS